MPADQVTERVNVDVRCSQSILHPREQSAFSQKQATQLVIDSVQSGNEQPLVQKAGKNSVKCTKTETPVLPSVTSLEQP